jgi:hypothetical protein
MPRQQSGAHRVSIREQIGAEDQEAWRVERMRDLIMAGCCQCGFLGTRIEKVPAFQGDSSNVEVALR